jgi:bifunctional non-homologous end joining protein LigD
MNPGAPQLVSVDGHRIRLTNLDKVLYPATGTTKGEVLDYLARIAPVLLPHVRHRPATRKRWPDGVDGPVFFQKDADASTPSWVRTHRIRHRASTDDYVLVDDLATLTWLGQTATLEIHVPQWRVGRAGAHLPPDRLVLDLDPGEGAGLPECAEVARCAREALTGMGLDPLPVTSGSKGIHLYAALDGRQDADRVAAAAHELARHLEAEHPDLVVSDMKKSLRAGKVFVDWSQNNGAKTTVAPYSLRGRERPTVAAPRRWEELDDPHLRQLTYSEVLERVERDGDLLAGLTAGDPVGAGANPRPASRPASRPAPGPAPRPAAAPAPPARPARLRAYDAKRDPARTPEPFDNGGEPRADGAPTFVIQEHHARRLHWDFRLERDGVLVSWALPKGEPTDPKQNHLAVQTEDHPLAYGGFEGTIPNGEYGAGTVTIWDRGTYRPEKWREGAEVIVTLHGERHGSRRLALIHTGSGDDEHAWLIHRTKEQPSDEGTRPGGLVVRPMLASLATPAERRRLAADPVGRDAHWAFETKWDGYRAIAVVEAADGGRRLRLLSRTGQDLTGTYPELAVLADQVTGELPVVLDGEIVALDRSGRPDFHRLQRHAGRVDLMVFDVLRVGSRSLLRAPYDERRRVLAGALDSAGPVHVPEAFDGDVEAALATSRRLGLEGVMAKRRDSTYLAGRRSRQWLKLKHTRTQEVVVVGWRPLHAGEPREDRHRAGSLLLAVPGPDGALRYAGRVGTGFGDADRRAVAARLASLRRTEPPLAGVPPVDARHARWVRPELVGEVEAAQWTADPATDPGARLRAPSWRGWRDDKRPDEVVVEV